MGVGLRFGECVVALPSTFADALGIGLSAFPQGSMDGRDLPGAVACENTHRPTPLLGRPEGGSLVPVRSARPATAGRGGEPQDIAV